MGLMISRLEKTETFPAKGQDVKDRSCVTNQFFVLNFSFFDLLNAKV
jgi:hypothetical protein